MHWNNLQYMKSVRYVFAAIFVFFFLNGKKIAITSLFTGSWKESKHKIKGVKKKGRWKQRTNVLIDFFWLQNKTKYQNAHKQPFSNKPASPLFYECRPCFCDSSKPTAFTSTSEWDGGEFVKTVMENPEWLHTSINIKSMWWLLVHVFLSPMCVCVCVLENGIHIVTVLLCHIMSLRIYVFGFVFHLNSAF